MNIQVSFVLTRMKNSKLEFQINIVIGRVWAKPKFIKLTYHFMSVPIN